MDDIEVTAESEPAVSVVTDTTQDIDDQCPATPTAFCGLLGLATKTSKTGTPSGPQSMSTKLGQPEESPLIPVLQTNVFVPRKPRQTSVAEDMDMASELSVPLIPVISSSSAVFNTRAVSTRTHQEETRIEASQSLLPQTDTQMASLKLNIHPTQPIYSHNTGRTVLPGHKDRCLDATDSSAKHRNKFNKCSDNAIDNIVRDSSANSLDTSAKHSSSLNKDSYNTMDKKAGDGFEKHSSSLNKHSDNSMDKNAGDGFQKHSSSLKKLGNNSVKTDIPVSDVASVTQVEEGRHTSTRCIREYKSTNYDIARSTRSRTNSQKSGKSTSVLKHSDNEMDKRNSLVKTTNRYNIGGKHSNSNIEVRPKQIADGQSQPLPSQTTTISSKSTKTSSTTENNVSKLIENYSQPFLSQTTVTRSKSIKTRSSMELGKSSQRQINPSPMKPVGDSTERINARLQKLLGHLDKVPKKQMLVMEAAIAQCVSSLQDSVHSKMNRLSTAYTVDTSDILKKLLQMIQSSLTQIINHHKQERQQLTNMARATSGQQQSKLDATIFKLDMESLADRQKRAFAMCKKQKEMVDRFKVIRGDHGESISLPSSSTTTPVKQMDDNVADGEINRGQKPGSDKQKTKKASKPVHSLFANIEKDRKAAEKKSKEMMDKKDKVKPAKEGVYKENHPLMQNRHGTNVQSQVDVGMNVCTSEGTNLRDGNKTLDDVGTNVDVGAEMALSQDITTIPDTQEISTENDGVATEDVCGGMAGDGMEDNGDETDGKIDLTVQGQCDSDCAEVDSDGETRCNVSDIGDEDTDVEETLSPPMKRKRRWEENDDTIKRWKMVPTDKSRQSLNVFPNQRQTPVVVANDKNLETANQLSRSEVLWSGMVKQTTVAENGVLASNNRPTTMDNITGMPGISIEDSSTTPNDTINHPPNQLSFQGEGHCDLYEDDDDDDDVEPMPIGRTDVVYKTDNKPMCGGVEDNFKQNKNNKHETGSAVNRTILTTNEVRHQPTIEKRKDFANRVINDEREVPNKNTMADLPGQGKHIEDTITSMVRHGAGDADNNGNHFSKTIDKPQASYTNHQSSLVQQNNVPVCGNGNLVTSKPTIDASKSWLSILPKSVKEAAKTVVILKPQTKDISLGGSRPTNIVNIATGVGNITASGSIAMFPGPVVRSGGILEMQNNVTSCRGVDRSQTNSACLIDRGTINKPSGNWKSKVYPPLRDLVQGGQLWAGRDVLSVNVLGRMFVASLTEAGLIRTREGTVFTTAVKWLCSLTNGAVTKRGAYIQILYNGRPLASFCSNAQQQTTNQTSRIVPPNQTSSNVPTNQTSKIVPPNNVESPVQSPDEIKLNEFLSTCRVRIISDLDVILSDDLPGDFWSDDFSKVKVSKDIWDSVDCWA